MKWRLRRYLSSRFLRRLVSPSRQRRAHYKAELLRKKEGRNHQVHYFHQLDDPYSHLAAQKLAAIAARYDVDVFPHLVGAPPEDALPDAARLKTYAQLDAARIAPFYNLTFAKNWQTPKAAEQLKVAQILAHNNCSYLADISTALWRGDSAQLDSYKKASIKEAETLLAEGTSLRKKLRHYSGAMFYYEGEWYWGIDRLNHLETRLINLGARRLGIDNTERVVQHRTFAPIHIDMTSSDKLKLEYFLSLRSPYSYLSIYETLALEKHYPVEIIFRPVMPMVMRGLKVPPVKGLYIFKDSKREAEIRGINFGGVIDPVGPPVLRGFSLFQYARGKGKAAEYLQSFLSATFAERIDVYSKKGLLKVVSRAGLSGEEAEQFIDNEGWHDELEKNRKAMLDMGCWGVPSYRLLSDEENDDFVVWGNDRIWLIREEMAQRLKK